jgi:regulator of sigma E protease
MEFLAYTKGILLVLILFSATIFVHEFGHFIVAKWLGLKIKTFSIGFGRAVFRKVHNDIEYKIGWLPFGGYVALPQMDFFASVEGGESHDGEREYPRITPGKKILVSLAGAVCNVMFAFVLAFVIFKVGMPASPSQLEPTIGFVNPDSPAYQEGGIRIGDQVVSLHDAGDDEEHSFASFQDFLLETALHKKIVLTVKDGLTGKLKQATLETTPGQLNIRGLPALAGVQICRVGAVFEGWSADRAGLKLGDQVISVGGDRVMSRPHMVWLLQHYPNMEVPFVIERNGVEMTLNVIPQENPAYDPEVSNLKYWIGMNFGKDWDKTTLDKPKPHVLVGKFSTLIFRILKALVTPREAQQAASGFTGPIGIMAIFWQVKESLMLAFWFTVLINVNLAIVNLLPIPILDGGHIMFSIWEWVTRRPAQPRFIAVVHNIFFVLLVSLFLFLTVRDVGNFVLPSLKDEPDQTLPVAPDGEIESTPFIHRSEALAEPQS